jgi:hypothetical protein
MKEEYDFSKGIRGKFYRKDAEFYLPIYLEPEVQQFVSKLAKEQKVNLDKIVNMLLLKDKELMQLLTPKA